VDGEPPPRAGSGRPHANGRLIGGNEVHCVQNIDRGFTVQSTGVRVNDNLGGTEINKPAEAGIQSDHLVFDDGGADEDRATVRADSKSVPVSFAGAVSMG